MVFLQPEQGIGNQKTPNLNSAASRRGSDICVWESILRYFSDQQEPELSSGAVCSFPGYRSYLEK